MSTRRENLALHLYHQVMARPLETHHSWSLIGDGGLMLGASFGLAHLLSGSPLMPAADLGTISRAELGLGGRGAHSRWGLRAEELTPVTALAPLSASVVTPAFMLDAPSNLPVLPRRLLSLQGAHDFERWSVDGQAAIGTFLDSATRAYAMVTFEWKLPGDFSFVGGGGVQSELQTLLAPSVAQPFGTIGVCWRFGRGLRHSWSAFE